MFTDNCLNAGLMVKPESDGVLSITQQTEMFALCDEVMVTKDRVKELVLITTGRALSTRDKASLSFVWDIAYMTVLYSFDRKVTLSELTGIIALVSKYSREKFNKTQVMYDVLAFVRLSLLSKQAEIEDGKVLVFPSRCGNDQRHNLESNRCC